MGSCKKMEGLYNTTNSTFLDTQTIEEWKENVVDVLNVLIAIHCVEIVAIVAIVCILYCLNKAGSEESGTDKEKTSLINSDEKINQLKSDVEEIKEDNKTLKEEIEKFKL